MAPLGLLAQSPARAQPETAAVAGIREFSPDYYTEFDPVSALDLVDRTPGFSARESDGGRGLSDVRSNILIDGKRPPPKGQSIRQLLDEMPYDHVERIELIDAGARLDVDMQGYPQVVNVVTIDDRRAYYEVVTNVRRTGNGDIRQQNERRYGVESTGSFDWDKSDFTFRGGLFDRSNQSPAGFVAIDPGNPEQRISSINRSDRRAGNFEIGSVIDLGDDSSVSFNAALATEDSTSSPISLIGDEQSEAFVDQSSESNQDQWDFSTEYQRPIGGTGTLMLALVDGLSRDLSKSLLNEGDLTRSSVNDRENGERAVRLRLTQSPSPALTIRTTATDAFNYFDGAFRLVENEIELPVQGSDSRVEEDRSSLGSAVDWNFTNRWTLAGELGLESYEIRSRALSTGLQTDPKGQVAILFRPQARTTFTLESRRDIGQLSFGRFLASSNLTSGILTAGANVLEPERSWTHSAKYDRRFGDVGVMTFELSREKVDNPVRQVALSDVLVVSRNTSSQTIDSLRASVEYPFEGFGREDLILSLSGRLSNSETIDPVTGEIREVSGINSWFWNIGLRRDPGDGKLAWGFELADWVEGDNYSVRTTRHRENSREWEAYVEWEPIEDLKFRTRLEGPRSSFRETSFFATVRTPGLEPFFLSSTTSRTDKSASFSVEWRRHEHFEVTASLSTRPEVRTAESLMAYDDSTGTLLTREVPTTPQAMLRLRFYN